jgi:UDPglucose 6-dehydrogenase
LKKNAKIKCYDPKAMNNFKNMYPDLDYCDDMYIAVTDSDCMVVMTDWDEFKQPDWEKIISLMKRKNVVDARNIYDKSVLINM